ncbi:MAG: thiol-disulfide oxidoreductase DCC family protein [Rhodospirillales bacterium]
MEPPVLIFDGVCKICGFGVQKVLKHDHAGIFHFAFAQGPVGSKLKAQYGLTPGDLENVALIANGQCYVKSTAALIVLDRLPGPWRALRILWLVPRPIRDFFYSLIARNRYRLFGKRDVCVVPTEEERSRFLDQG